MASGASQPPASEEEEEEEEDTAEVIRVTEGLEGREALGHLPPVRAAASLVQPWVAARPFLPQELPKPCDYQKRGILNQNQLMRYLQLAQSREERLWRSYRPQTEIHQAFQDLVLWILNVENIFSFNQATMNLALTIFVRLLASVKVRERLFHIVIITSLRLAVKINEEEESVPCVRDFIEHYGPVYSPNELQRMELAILDTLSWDLIMGTSLDFLTTFHALVVLKWPCLVELLPQRNPSLHVESLTRQLQHCIAGHQLLQFKGSTLALVIITLELERLIPDGCAPTSDLLKKAQVHPEQFSCCKELVRKHLRRFHQQL